MAASALLLAALACSLEPPRGDLPAPSSAVATRTAVSPEPAASDTAALPPTTAPPTPTPPPQIPKSPLSANGPWLLLTAPDGYWALNPDGSGLTHLMAPPPYFQPGPVSPSGARVAFVGADDAGGQRGLKLYTLALPGGEMQMVTPLTGPATEPDPNAQAGAEAAQLLFPVGQSAWSPDGQRLAFIGLMDGPSADLYVYSLMDGSLARLTDGPSQAYQPRWSPDGQYVIQTGALSFGSGAGYEMAGVWAARADNSAVLELYTPDSGDERLHGWLSPDTFIVDSFRAQCSVGDLRAFSLTTLEFTALFEGFYNSVAFDAAHGQALVAVDDFTSECEGSRPAGFYLAWPGGEPRLLAEGDATAAAWLPEADLFFGRLDGALVAYTADGQRAPLPPGLDSLPWVAPDGQSWAWSGPEGTGLMVSVNGEPARSIDTSFIFRAAWSPDGQTLFFDGDGVFYAAYAPGFVPAPIATGLLDAAYPTVMTWVER